MTLKYKKITRKTWDNQKNIPKCPDKGAFEVAYYGGVYFIVDGKIHREDGPSWIRGNGEQYYYRHGKLHREDGPAFIGHNGKKVYYLFDRYHSKEQWELKILQINLKEQIL